MSDVNKAVRFSKTDWKLVSSFLDQNSFFDFSSLARTAVLQFIKNPKLELKAVTQSEKKPNQSIQSKSTVRRDLGNE